MLFLPKISGQESFENDSIISTLFNENEIADLEKILVFFEGQIESILKEKNTYNRSMNVHRNYLNFISIPPNDRDFDTFISINDQLLFYNQISASTFNKIWEFDITTITETMIDYKYLTYRRGGNYISFLKKLGDEYEHFASYPRLYESMGTFCASVWWHPIIEHEKYNLEDIKVRLFVAIHFMTINDQAKRKEKISLLTE